MRGESGSRGGPEPINNVQHAIGDSCLRPDSMTQNAVTKFGVFDQKAQEIWKGLKPRYEHEKVFYLLGEISIEERGERSLLGWLDDDSAPGGEGWADLEEEHGSGEVPGDDGADHPDGLFESVTLKLSGHLERQPVDLVGRPGEVTQSFGASGDVHDLI